jgi:hypothetical protein
MNRQSKVLTLLLSAVLAAGSVMSMKRRPTGHNPMRSILLSGALGLSTLSLGQALSAEELFIGDVGDSSVKQFDEFA